MEQITKNFKLIGGILLLICCALPFGTISIMGIASASINGFNFFGGGLFALIAILLILAGAGALIFVSVTKNNIQILPKFDLVYLAKIAALAGTILALVAVFTTQGLGIGFGLILAVLVAVALFFEDQIIAAIGKNEKK